LTVARSYLSYKIRRAEASDLLGVCAVERTCFRDPYPSEALNDLIKDHQDHFFVASDHGEIVGYAVASANAAQGHVFSIAVDPRHRRGGIATALLSAVTVRLAEEGVECMQLEVRRGNTGAIAFYEQAGYRVSALVRHYYADGEDALVLVRSVERETETTNCT